MNEAFPPTYYAATARPAPARRALAQDVEAEVCVVGGGLAGLWTARALLARVKDVVVLEAGEVAAEASGQNGGFVSAGYAERLGKIVERVGVDHARELYRLSREGVEAVRAFLAEGDFGLDPVPGRLNVQRHDDEVGLRDLAEMLARDFDHDVVLWPRERVREMLATDRYYQALHEADAFHLHPLNLARALAADVENRGGTIYERSRVIAADLGGLRKSATTEGGRVRAFQVVLAGGAFLGEAFPALAATVLPVRTHVAVTAPLGERLAEAIRYPGAIADTRRAGDYYRVVGDRLLWGGRITTKRKPPKELASLMAEDIAKVYPQLGGAPIDYAWSGTMSYAVHKMPQIGPVQPGVWIASAFGGHGLNTTAMAGELVAGAIAEQDDRWRLFIPFGLVWAGGGLGRAATQASYWSMQVGDWVDEAQTKRVEQVQADIAAGLAPGLAAFAARRAKRKFAESRAGRISARVAAAAYFVLSRLLVGLRWVGAIVYAVSAAVGRLLYVVIMAVATVIGFIASWVGWGMEMVAAGIVFCARGLNRLAVLLWGRLAMPLLQSIAAGTQWAWQRSRLGSTRLAQAIQAGAILAGNRARAGAATAAAQIRAGIAWCGARAAERARSAAASTTAGAKRLAAAGQQAALLSGERTREGALWSVARAREGVRWSAQRIADAGRLAWERVILPGAKRAADGIAQARGRIRTSSAQIAARTRENAGSLGARGTKFALDGVKAAIGVVADARRRHAEAGRAADIARKEMAEAAASEPSKEPAAAGAEPAKPEEPQPKKTTMAKEQDSIEA